MIVVHFLHGLYAVDMIITPEAPCPGFFEILIPLSATYLSLAATSMRALLLSRNVLTTRVRLLVELLSRSMTLLARCFR